MDDNARAAIQRMVEATECPACGHQGMELSWRLRARPIGTFSLAGSQMKVSATEVPVVKCPECGIEAEGKYGPEEKI